MRHRHGDSITGTLPPQGENDLADEVRDTIGATFEAKEQKTRADAAEKALERAEGMKKWGELLGQISVVLAMSDDLPCDPDEFSWEDIPQMLADMLGVNHKKVVARPTETGGVSDAPQD